MHLWSLHYFGPTGFCFGGWSQYPHVRSPRLPGPCDFVQCTIVCLRTNVEKLSTKPRPRDEAPDTVSSRFYRCGCNNSGDDLCPNCLGSGIRRNHGANLRKPWRTYRCASIAYPRVRKLVQDVESEDVSLEEWTGVEFDGLTVTNLGESHLDERGICGTTRNKSLSLR